MEQVGPHIEHGAHEEAAGASAFDGQAVLGAVPVGDQVLGAGDEVGESVFLVHHAAIVVPSFAQFAATTNVSDGGDYATIDHAEHVRVEEDVVGDSAGSISVQVQRAAAVPLGVLEMAHGDWNLNAIGNCSVDALHLVACPVVSAGNLLLLEEG